MSVVSLGNRLEIPNLTTISYLEDPSLHLKIPGDGGRRRTPVDSVVLHTTGGYPDHKHPAPQWIDENPALPEHCEARSTIDYWRRSDRVAGAHLVLDADATLYCTCDLLLDVAYHCPGMNSRSIGIEIVQGSDSRIWRAQLEVLPILARWLLATFNLQETVVYPYRGVRANLSELRGFLGHRDASANRGVGDPGDYVMECLPEEWRRV